MKAHLNTQTKKSIYTLGLVGALFSTYSFQQKTESLDLASVSTPAKSEEIAAIYFEGKTYTAKYYDVDGDSVVKLEASDGNCNEFCGTYITNVKTNIKNLSDANNAVIAQLESKNKSKAKSEDKDKTKSETKDETSEDKTLDYLAETAEACNSKLDDSAIVACHKTAFLRITKESKTRKISEEQLRDYWKENVRDLLKSELEFSDDEYDYSDKLADMKDYIEDIKDQKSIPNRLKKSILLDIGSSIKSTYQEYLHESSESIREKGMSYQNDLKQASFDFQSGMLSPSELPYVQSELFEQRNELLQSYNMSFSDARKAQSMIAAQQGLIPNSSEIFRTHFEKPMNDLMIQMRLDPAGQINPIQSSFYHPSIVQDPFAGLDQSRQAPAVSSRLNLTGDRFALYNNQDPNQVLNQNNGLVNHQAVLPQNGLPTVRGQQVHQQNQYNNVLVNPPQNSRLLWKGF